jgi:hypothetical protein
MHERAPRKETIGRGELLFLSHPGADETFSGYGLTMQPGTEELLVGLLMVDRPHAADPEWLAEVEATFGEYELVAMTLLWRYRLRRGLWSRASDGGRTVGRTSHTIVL